MHVVDANTLALWPLDDLNPSNLRNLVPGGPSLVSNASHMVLFEGPERTTVLPINVRDLTPVYASASFPWTWIVAASGALTVEFWFRFLDSRDYVGTSMLMGFKLTNNDIVSSPFKIRFTGNSMHPGIVWNYDNYQAITVYANTEVSNYDKAWHHLAVVRSAPVWYSTGNYFRCDVNWYIDGVSAGSAINQRAWDNYTRGEQAGTFFLGSAYFGEGAPWDSNLPFCVSDVRISNTARSAEEIAAYYTSYTPPSITPSLGRYTKSSQGIFRLSSIRTNYARSSQPVIGLLKTVEDVVPVDTFTADSISASPGTITITFSDPCVVNGRASDPKEWIVADTNGKILDVTNVVAQGSTIILATEEQTTGTHYSLVFPSAGIQDDKGKRLDGPFSMGFTGVGITPTISWSRSEDARTLLIGFSEPVIESDATNVANYSITGGLQVLGATKISDTIFRLTTTPQSSGAHYTISASNIRDLAQNPV